MSTEPGRYGDADREPADAPDEGDDWPVSGRFSRWRNTRPFWGALLILLSGAIILLFEKAPTSVIIHIGVQGVAGYLIPVIMLLCGVLLLVNPVQRAFYSILAILLALGSFITSNFGGFFVGMLLGLVGGSLAFAWEQRGTVGQRRRPQHRGGFRPPAWMRQRSGGAHGLSLVLGDKSDDPAGQGDGEQHRSRPGAASEGRPSDEIYRALGTSLAAAGAVLLAGSLPAHHGATGGHHPPAKRTAAVPGSVGEPAATASALTASSAVLTGWTFAGVAHVATARGVVAMLEFTMTSLALSGTTLRVVVADVSAATTAASLGLSGGVVLLATKFSGELHGRIVTYTPSNPPASVPANATVTDVVTGQPYLAAGLLQTTGLAAATPQEA